MITLAACLIAAAAILYILGVRAKDLPAAPPVSPFQHLDERKAAIYDNLRDLQFEYRLGKLSDQDYQQTKLDLQKELAGVMAEIDRVKQGIGAGKQEAASKPLPKPALKTAYVCPSCGAGFQQELKFCGECGKPMRLQA